MTYSEIIGVEKHFKSAFDITSDIGESWKTFITNDRFEYNLNQIINCFTSPIFDHRNSIWIQGTYGTGKSHSVSVIKHLLCDKYNDIEDYIPRINKAQLRNSLENFRQEKTVFPVILKGIYSITDVADLTYTIQQQVAIALKKRNIEIATKTDFESVIQILQKGDLDSFFNKLINNNKELHSYALSKVELIKALENNETKVIRIIADELKNAGLGGFRTHNIIEWLIEIKNELVQQGVADYLMILWDEFTSLLDIPARRSILNLMQDIAELSKSEVDNGSDTLGIYLFLVTHKRLEQTESYKELKQDERNMAKARFIELDYSMQPTTTYHILSGALERKNPEVLTKLCNKNFLNVASVCSIVNKVVDMDTPNASEVKEKIISLYPFHPYTSYLATFVSRVVGEAERSIFGFLNDEQNGFKRFIDNEIDNPSFMTADYVWDFFYNTFEATTIGRFDAITNKYKLSNEVIKQKGENYIAVFKIILLLNILYRVTTTDADVSEKSMVNPCTENIISAFSGVLDETTVRKILNDIDDSQIVHRSPDGIFEVSSSSLPQKKLLEEKKKLYFLKEDVSKILNEYSIKCLGKLKKCVSQSIMREVNVKVFWAGEKEHLLRGKIDNSFSTKYTVNVAVFVMRGDTSDLDQILGRSEASINDEKDMLIKISKEAQFNNVIFVLANAALGNKRFEAYLDSLAQESVARSLQMEEERKEGQQNAEKWIVQWVDEIINSGMSDMIFRGDSIHVPFSQGYKYLKENYIGTIFEYGLDSLPASSTAWPHQVSKKAVELILYSQDKTTLEQEAKGVDSVVKTLLMYNNQLIFDEKLQLISDDEKIPVVKACKEVKRKIEEFKKEPFINLAEVLKFFSEPAYGYYQNRLFMGTLALALRPFVDRMYVSGNGQRVDKIVMKDVVIAIFNNWESNKFNDKYVVRMSTEEERELTYKLNTVFGINDKDGLLETKWAIREKFKNKNKAPLWALKYAKNSSEMYCIFIDMLFRFSKSIDENINQEFIEKLLEGIKTFDVELSNVISNVESESFFDTYIISVLHEINEDDKSLFEVKKYLSGKLSGDIVFWEEHDVHEKILLWKIDKNNTNEISGNDIDSNFSNCISGNLSPNSNNSVFKNDDIKKRAKEKLLTQKGNSEKLYEVLLKLVDNYINIATEIDKFL